MMKRIALLILYLSIGLTATSYAEKLPHVSYYRAADGLEYRAFLFYLNLVCRTVS